MHDQALTDVEGVANAFVELITQHLRAGAAATSVAAGIAVALTRLGQTGALGAELRDAIVEAMKSRS